MANKVDPSVVKVKGLGPSKRSPGAVSRATGKPCSRCNQLHIDRHGQPGCTGHKRKVRPYRPCIQPTMNGQNVCVNHGGNLPQNKAKAAVRVAFANTQGEVAKLLSECDLPEQHPIDGLLEVVRHSGAMMRLLHHLVSGLGLDPGELKLNFADNGRVTKYVDTDKAIFGYNSSGDQAAHVLVMLYGMWADRYARACKLALDANIDERLVRNAESTTNAVFTAVSRAIDKAKLDPAQAQAFSLTLADELRKLAGPMDDLPRRSA